jgi:hypothetical protein
MISRHLRTSPGIKRSQTTVRSQFGVIGILQSRTALHNFGFPHSSSLNVALLSPNVVFYMGVPLERVIKNTRFTAFSYQFELFNQPF